MTQEGSDLQGVYDLTAKQQRLLVALLEEPSTTAAAAACGISRRTASRMLSDANFQDALRQAQDTAFSAAMSAFGESMEVSRRVLLELVEDKKTPPTVRARSAEGLITLALRAAEHRRRVHATDTLERKLDELSLLVEAGAEREERREYGI